MNWKAGFVASSMVLPALMFVFTLIGYYIERYTSFAYWDGMKACYVTTMPELAYQHLVYGITFSSFVFVVSAAFCPLILYLDQVDNPEESSDCL